MILLTNQVAKVRLRADRVSQVTKVTEAYAEMPLCLRQPKNQGYASQVFISTLGGGLLPHDHSHMQVTVGEGAHLFLGSQAANRIFKSTGMVCRQRVEGEIKPEALLVHCPDTLTPFAESRLHQSQTWVLHPQGRLCLGEVFQAGRLSRNEIYAMHSYRSDWRVENPEGRPLLLDRISLEAGGMDAVRKPGCLALPEIMGGQGAAIGIRSGHSLGSLPVYTQWASFAFCGLGWQGLEASLARAWQAEPVWPFGVAGPDEARRNIQHNRLTALWRKDENVLMARILAVDRESMYQALRPLHDSLASPDALGFSPWARKF